MSKSGSGSVTSAGNARRYGIFRNSGIGVVKWLSVETMVLQIAKQAKLRDSFGGCSAIDRQNVSELIKLKYALDIQQVVWYCV